MTENQLNQVINHIWANRNKFRKLADTDQDFYFDYPDYGGLPNKIIDKLSPEAVDAMQSIWTSVTGLHINGDYDKKRQYKTKQQFSMGYQQRLAELGERITHRHCPDCGEIIKAKWNR